MNNFNVYVCGRLVSMLAAVLAFILNACSDDHVAGGVTEETRIYALAGRVGEVYPKIMNVEDAGQGTATLPQNYNNVLRAKKGTVVTIYEMDPLTLDTTGRFFVDSVGDDSGRFAFDDVSLKCPYVLIEAREPQKSLSKSVASNELLKAVVDLRKEGDINVNLLTTIKVPLLRSYYAAGESFDDANKRAERDVLEDLGVYEDLGSFDQAYDENSELAYVAQMLANAPNAEKIAADFRNYVPLYYVSSKIISVLDSEYNQYLLNTIKMINYDVASMARKSGLGRCTEARENEEAVIMVDDSYSPAEKMPYAIVCRSGNWVLGFKKIDYQTGSMEDSRDGKIYKTVSYNWGEVSQTWMAENLDFTDTISSTVDSALKVNLSKGLSCYRNYDGGCRLFGHAYSWMAAMNVGSDDMAEEVLSRDSTRDYEFHGSYVVPFTQDEINNHQGVCPDGWRVPSLNDWQILLKNMGTLYGVGFNKVVPALYDETATGFGLTSVGNIGVDGDYNDLVFNNVFIVADMPPYKIEFFIYDYGNLAFESEQPHGSFGRMNGQRNAYNPDVYNPYLKGAVRCIKK